MALQTEQSLSSSLAHLISLKPPKTIPNTFVPNTFVQANQLWPADNPGNYSLKAIAALQAGAIKGGSWNWVMLGLACALAAKVPGADDACIAWLTLLKTKYGWMGTEVGTRDQGYWYYYLVAACVMVRLGSPALKALAWEFLDLWRFWAWTGAPMVGQRSALPGIDTYQVSDETTDFLRGGALPGIKPPTLDRLFVQCVLPELKALRARPLANPKWVMATPVTFYVSPAQAIVVLGASVNGNTLAVLAGGRVTSLVPGRATQWLPLPPWGSVDKKTGAVTRIRQQFDSAQAAVVEPTASAPGIIRYVSSIFRAGSMTIPAGSVRYHLGNGLTSPA